MEGKFVIALSSFERKSVAVMLWTEDGSGLLAENCAPTQVVTLDDLGVSAHTLQYIAPGQMLMFERDARRTVPRRPLEATQD